MCENVVDQCIIKPCANNGICISQPSLKSKKKTVCLCPLGFSGAACETILDTCAIKAPCLNGGSCNSIGLDNYSCSCSFGYTGVNCETLDSCVSSPCLNGAECISLFPQGFQW